MSQHRYADEITDLKGKRHYVGMTSPASRIARDLNFRVRTVEISGHCICTTVNQFAHWQGPLMDGPVHINGERPNLEHIATVEEYEIFMATLMTDHDA